MNNKLLLLVILVVLAAMAWIFWPQLDVLLGREGGAEEGVACTMDAMQCSDGSWVGRTGPNCEFVCPGA